MRKVETPRVLLNIFTPLSGTDSIDRADELGIEFHEDYYIERSVVGHGYVNYRTKHLSADTIKKKWMEGQGIVMQKARRRKVARHKYGMMS